MVNADGVLELENYSASVVVQCQYRYEMSVCAKSKGTFWWARSLHGLTMSLHVVIISGGYSGEIRHHLSRLSVTSSMRGRWYQVILAKNAWTDSKHQLKMRYSITKMGRPIVTKDTNDIKIKASHDSYVLRLLLGLGLLGAEGMLSMWTWLKLRTVLQLFKAVRIDRK